MVNVNILHDNHATMSGYESYPSDWDRRRRYVYKRDNYQCQRCGVTGGPRGNDESLPVVVLDTTVDDDVHYRRIGPVHGTEPATAQITTDDGSLRSIATRKAA